MYRRVASPLAMNRDDYREGAGTTVDVLKYLGVERIFLGGRVQRDEVVDLLLEAGEAVFGGIVEGQRLGMIGRYLSITKELLLAR